jgi:hypothetical protein
MKYMALCAMVAALSIVGCKANSNCCKTCKAPSEVKAGTDVCTHCPGVQTATADGKCSGCGMALK